MRKLYIPLKHCFTLILIPVCLSVNTNIQRHSDRHFLHKRVTNVKEQCHSETHMNSAYTVRFSSSAENETVRCKTPCSGIAILLYGIILYEYNLLAQNTTNKTREIQFACFKTKRPGVCHYYTISAVSFITTSSVDRIVHSVPEDNVSPFHGLSEVKASCFNLCKFCEVRIWNQLHTQ